MVYGLYCYIYDGIIEKKNYQKLEGSLHNDNHLPGRQNFKHG